MSKMCKWGGGGREGVSRAKMEQLPLISVENESFSSFDPRLYICYKNAMMLSLRL